MHIYCPKCEAASPEDAEFCSLCAHPFTAPTGSTALDAIEPASTLPQPAPPSKGSGKHTTKLKRTLSRKSRSILAICNLAAVLVLVAYWAGSRSSTDDQAAKDAAVGQFMRDMLTIQSDRTLHPGSQSESTGQVAIDTVVPSQRAIQISRVPAFRSIIRKCPRQLTEGMVQRMVEATIAARRGGLPSDWAVTLVCEEADDPPLCDCFTEIVRFVYARQLTHPAD